MATPSQESEIVGTGATRLPSEERGERRLRVLLVGSAGGHLLQLHRLKPWWERHDRAWVTFRMPDSESLLAGEEVAWAHHPTTRNIPNMFRNLGLAWRLVRSYRPQVVVSSGAGVAFPFFLVGRLFGARAIYIEVYDRIDLPTLTGKLCYPLSNLFLLQWEQQKRFYRRGVVIGRLL
jgi:UDP-N-acetylglucosamine:LPS N-acetylglucosamine transferase